MTFLTGNSLSSRSLRYNYFPTTAPRYYSNYFRAYYYKYFQALTNYFKEIQQALPFNRGQRNGTFLILTYSARHYNGETYDVTN